MNKKVKCKFCKREVFLNDFRSHLRIMHPELVKEKVPIERVESMGEESLLVMFTMMEILQEDTRFNASAADILVQEEFFSGKGGESGGAGASGSWDEEKCDAKCESCNLHEEEPDSDSGDSSDSSDSSSDNE